MGSKYTMEDPIIACCVARVLSSRIRVVEQMRRFVMNFVISGDPNVMCGEGVGVAGV